jgi:lysophosphatidylcholine acyltransferase/lyso-PAF acetyltransferase
MSTYERCKVALCVCSGLVVVRVVSIAMLVGVAYVLARVSLLGSSGRITRESSPPAAWRLAVLAPMRVLCRGVLLVLGVWRLETRGRLDPRACLVTPNHVSALDLLAIYSLMLPSALSKAETFGIPLIGTIFRALSVIPLAREHSSDRALATDLIRKLAESRAEGSSALGSTSGRRGAPTMWPPVLVFPQGTTTRERCMNMFQRGAFFGLPVQPVALHYPWRHFDPAFVVNRASDWYSVRMLCQLRIDVEVSFLPLHVPSAAECADATLFAANVRAEIADALGAEVTEHSFEDAKLYRCALTCKGARDEHLPERLVQGLALRNVRDALDGAQFSLDHAKAALEHFCRLDTDGDGRLDLRDFCTAAGYDPQSKHAKRLFALLDLDGSGKIDFREMLMAIAMASPDSTGEARLRCAFELYDADADGAVSATELTALLAYSGHTWSEHAKAARKQAEHLIAQAHGQPVTWHQFKKLVPSDSPLVSTAFLSIDGHKQPTPTAAETNKRPIEPVESSQPTNMLAAPPSFFPPDAILRRHSSKLMVEANQR